MVVANPTTAVARTDAQGRDSSTRTRRRCSGCRSPARL